MDGEKRPLRSRPPVYTAAIMTGPVFVLLIAVVVVVFFAFRVLTGNENGNSTFKVEAPPADINREQAQDNATKNPGRPEARTVSRRKRLSKTSEIPERFVVLDLETTGLSARYNEIIEIGAILVEVGSMQHLAFQTLVRPSVPIPRNITALTGITQEMVDNDGIDISTALAQFVSFIGDLPLVAFNAPFDISFLEAAAAKCRLSIVNPHSCALALARRAWPGLPSYKLSELAKMGNLPLDNAHRSMGDCERTAVVYLAAASKLHGKTTTSYPRIPFSAGYTRRYP
jgi:DNA polymerase III subunit epsilon